MKKVQDPSSSTRPLNLHAKTTFAKNNDYFSSQAAKCLFRKYGSGGDFIDHDALCILSLNIINEKVRVYKPNPKLVMIVTS
jgi:hypothetical protein